MAESLPLELARLLAASDDIARTRAWTEFLHTFSPLILHASRTAASGYDDGMDAYASALDGLRADNYKKLRGYAIDPASRFSTWLVVVVRRICIDAQRQKYGRTSTKEREEGISDERRARHRLANLVGAEINLDELRDSQGMSADEAVEQRELGELLDAALAELDERDRLLLTLKFVDDLPANKIASVQGWPDQMSVYRRITKLTAMLKEKLVARGVDTPII